MFDDHQPFQVNKMLSLEVDVKFEHIDLRKIKEVYKSRNSTLRNFLSLH
jgi:hypothetical protein